MLKQHLGLIVLSVTALCLLPACGGSGGAESPKALLESMAQGIEDGDSGQVASLVDQSTPVGQLMGSAFGKMAEISVAAKKMEASVEKKFGKEAAQKVMSGSAQMNPAGDPHELINDAKIEVNGDKATVTNPKKPQSKLQLVNKGGRWYIDAEAMAGEKAKSTSPEELKKAAEMMDKMFGGMIQVFEDTSLVDQSKTAEEFEKKFGEKMMGVIFGMIGEAMQKGS